MPRRFSTTLAIDLSLSHQHPRHTIIINMINSTANIRLFYVTFKTSYGYQETWPIYDTSLTEAIKHVHQLNSVEVTVTRVDDPELMIK
jgi:hypothetical protein